MKSRMMSVKLGKGRARRLPVTWVHTLVVGSGAAGLNTAVQLHRQGVTDLLIVTEGLKMGTSINTGSDKQTYYKIGLYGEVQDSPVQVAEALFSGGSMHGDLALAEASTSARAFLNLVNLGVPFPRDRYGQFVGYKTDHDPRQRATSIGPYTSREMCRALIREVERNGIAVREGRTVASLIVAGEGARRRAAGAVALNARGQFEVYAAENVVFATGGPGGLYQTSVYPKVHNGGIGVALLAGAKAQSLPESQYGLASTQFRWNVSGTYMQVVPRFISTAADGKSDAREFLREYFDTPGQMNSMVFLKGYQWPFDSRKIAGGSSIVDILVYIENVVRGRRIFLDFRSNPQDFSFDELSPEAREYLVKSKALQATPIERLRTMNPGAIELYRDHQIDITKEPLEIAVCAQHNNGGLAGSAWWESANLRHLFPVGEVNGSHGVYRPGGSALNSGQVAGFRASEFIANRYAKWTLDARAFGPVAAGAAAGVLEWVEKGKASRRPWKRELDELRQRMTRAGAHIRSRAELDRAAAEARTQWERIEADGVSAKAKDLPAALMMRQMCFAHLVYLEAVRFAVASGVGSRGSAMVLDPAGTVAHGKLGPEWSFVPEDPAFRERVLETAAQPDGSVSHEWVPRRPMPASDAWFETAWAAFRKGEIYEG